MERVLNIQLRKPSGNGGNKGQVYTHQLSLSNIARELQFDTGAKLWLER